MFLENIITGSLTAGKLLTNGTGKYGENLSHCPSRKVCSYCTKMQITLPSTITGTFLLLILSLRKVKKTECVSEL